MAKVTVIERIIKTPALGLMMLIKIYQKLWSPDHSWRKTRYPGGFCRFYPTCSEYAYQVINKRGLIVGLVKSFWRVLRCNPWSKGGVDLP